MGSNTGLLCQNCFYSKEFMTGMGMMYFNLNLAVAEKDFDWLTELITSKKIQLHIRKLIEEKNASIKKTYGHDVYHCKSCNKFYSRFFIHLDFEDKSFEPDYKCPKCKKPLKLVDYTIVNKDKYWTEKEWNFSKYPCPKCKEKCLIEFGRGTMMWD